MALTTIFFLFLLAFTISNGLYINLEGKRDYCFFVTVAEGVNITISYVVSGYNENLVSMKVQKNLNTQKKNI